MTIRANIEKRIVEMQGEIKKLGVKGGDISQQVKEGAISAILGGKEERIAYMEIFATTPNELARLIPTDGTEEDQEKREARAYLVANAVCAPGTATGLVNNVFDILDTPPVEEELHADANASAS